MGTTARQDYLLWMDYSRISVSLVLALSEKVAHVPRSCRELLMAPVVILHLPMGKETWGRQGVVLGLFEPRSQH